MKTKYFIVIDADFLSLISENEIKNFYFSDYGINKINWNFVNEIISENTSNTVESEFYIVVSDTFLEIREKITTKIKTNHISKYKSFCKNNFVLKSGQKQPILSHSRTLLYNNKEYQEDAEIPIMSQFFIKDIIVKINENFFNEFIIGFYESFLNVKGVFSLSSLNSMISSEKHSYNVYVGNKNITISEAENGNILWIDKIDTGFENLIIKIGNKFNLSTQLSKKLVQFHGYMILPKKYVNLVVSVPVFSDFKINIPMVDLSYELRESYKEMIGVLNDRIWKNKRDANKNSYFLRTAINIKGIDTITSLSLGLEKQNIDFSGFDDNILNDNNNHISLVKSRGTKQVETIDKKVREKQSLMESVVNFFYKKFLPLLLE
ncbi:MAG: hypothetical protein WHW07_11940 [Bacteroidales bacterium]|nr:hypothetical protein [Bacteroidales bacterium]HOL97923.1 hypothetical protein [Bacteroidales bacterium]HPD23569.1 hypothetical protein [Bacteroidales bacterium]HRS99125.1 hypothetical protein [Bacteroidales bacterium]HRT79735.1 hypothetical protein [Bacteroidales bacterium]